jgi:hypothetical protein
LIAFRSNDRAVLMFGFAKNEMDDIDPQQLATLRDVAASWFSANAETLARAIADGILIEVKLGTGSKEEPLNS